MEYTITENRLRKLFVNYMDYQYDLIYDYGSQDFMDKNGRAFGYISTQHRFQYWNSEYVLNELFGELTNELVLHYLRERFPDVRIDGLV